MVFSASRYQERALRKDFLQVNNLTHIIRFSTFSFEILFSVVLLTI